MVKASQNSPQNIKQALTMMASSLELIYSQFQVYFHIFFLILIAYIFYVLGKISISEPLADKTKKLSQRIEKAEKNRDQLPKRIVVNQSRKKYVSILIMICVIGGALSHFSQVGIGMMYIGITFGVLFCYWVYLLVQHKFLINKRKMITEEDKNIRMNVKQLSESLGTKIQQQLKTNLCKDKLLLKSRKSSLQCTKRQCIEYRGALKSRLDALKHLTESALNYEWCSICKKRNRFDELVKYESKNMPEIPTDDENTEVTLRIKFMLDLLQSISRWVNEASPCNCSKLYIDQILHNKKIYSQISKKVNEKIKNFEHLQKKNFQKKIQEAADAKKSPTKVQAVK